MGRAASGDVAAREMHVAAGVVKLRQLPCQPLRASDRLGLRERRQRRVESCGETVTGGDAEQRAAALCRLRRCRKRIRVGDDGGIAFPRLAAQPPAQHVERVHIGGLARERGAAFGERKSLFRMQCGRLRLRSGEVRPRGFRRFGAIEVLRVQRRIALAVPRRCGTVQLGPARARQRRIDAVADQRVREQEFLAIGAHQ